MDVILHERSWLRGDSLLTVIPASHFEQSEHFTATNGTSELESSHDYPAHLYSLHTRTGTLHTGAQIVTVPSNRNMLVHTYLYAAPALTQQGEGRTNEQ